MKLELSYSKKTTAEEGVATEREIESTLTRLHTCHRARIPFGHVLIERICGSKHCRRKEREKNPPQQQQQKVPFQ